MNLNEYIANVNPHNKRNGRPPHDAQKRHEWESKILYTVDKYLSDDTVLLDFGCGPNGTMKYSLESRYPNAKFIGIDPVREDKTVVRPLEELDDAIEKATVIVAGSVFTHFGKERMIDFLDKIKYHMINRNLVFGFSIFLSETWRERQTPFYGQEGMFHVVESTEEFYEDYCSRNGLEFELKNFTHKIHKLQIKSGPKDNVPPEQHFAMIRKAS